MEHSVIQLVGSTAIGLYVIFFARATFMQPERIRQRWYSGLPKRQWASTLLRCAAVFWMFGGFLLIANGLVALPFFGAYRGVKLLICVVIVAAAFAGLLAAHTRRPERLRQ
jgi:hypothetical protein